MAISCASNVAIIRRIAKAALRTRLEAMDVVERRATEGAANAMDASSSVLRKRTRNMDEHLASDPTEMGNNGQRSRGDAPEIASAADMSVAQEHAVVESGP